MTPSRLAVSCAIACLVFLAFAALVAVDAKRVPAGQPPIPKWGGYEPIYTVTVNMTNPWPVANWTFQYYFDGTPGALASRYEHPAPQFDEMCEGQPYDGSKYRCDVLFAADGWSYIIFPETPQGEVCCKCGNSFGSTLWNWLDDNSTYAGITEVNGLRVQEWLKWGNMLNHYFVTDDIWQAAVRYSEIWSDGVHTNPKAWDFDMESLRTGPESYDMKSKLLPPPNCPLCTNELCQELRE